MNIYSHMHLYLNPKKPFSHDELLLCISKFIHAYCSNGKQILKKSDISKIKIT